MGLVHCFAGDHVGGEAEPGRRRKGVVLLGQQEVTNAGHGQMACVGKAQGMQQAWANPGCCPRAA